MRLPIPCADQTRAWALLARATARAAAAAVIVTSSGVCIAAAGSSSTLAPADARSIAKQLAAATASDPVGSCGADATAVSPFAMFGAGGAFGAGAGMQAAPVSSPLVAMCALPYERSRHGEHSEHGEDCSAEHTITYQVLGAGPNAKVTAELMGLDAKGNILKSFLVTNGDEAQLASRRSRREWRFRAEPREHEYTVVAPVPLLHVTVEDQGQKAEAFCSNIPFVEVIEPKGGVVSDSSGNATNVLAAVPQTDPSALHLFVDGGDLLTGVPNYLGCNYLSPCSGTATVNGQTVNYTNLMVDIASSISSLSPNTVRVTLNNLSCGGHVVQVSSSELDQDKRHELGRWGRDDRDERGRRGKRDEDEDDDGRQCFERLTDKGVSSVFAISISDPVPGEITPIVPTPVAGEVCSGTQIVDVNINGKTLSVAGETLVAGNGTTTGDVYKVVINTTLDRTDLVRDALQTHDAPLGTFDDGTNRLAVSAKEIGGSRTYKSLIFATGAVAPIGKAAGLTVLGADGNAQVFQQAAIQTAVNDQIQQLVQSSLPTALAPTKTELANAFIVGISAGGAQTLFNKLCSAPNPAANNKTIGQIFSDTLKSKLLAFDYNHPVSTFTLDLGACPSCNPGVRVYVASVDIGTDVTCPITFSDGKFSVSMNLPNISLTAAASGQCETDLSVCIPFTDDCASVCVAKTTVDFKVGFDVTNINLRFDVTEDNLLHTTTSAPNFHPGAGVQVSTNGGVSFDCIGGKLCEWTLDLIGLITGNDLLKNLDDLHIDFSTQIGATQPDPVKLKQIKVDEQVVANFDQKLSGDVTEVHIDRDGITAGLKGTFATTVVDSTVSDTPGITLTPAPVPTMGAMRAQGAQDALIGLSDDSINMMFASLTAAGKLKTGDAQGCSDTTLTVGSLLPTSCDSLSLDNDVITVGARGYCHAIKSDDCSSISFNDPALSSTDNANLTATEQGICHGAEGHICSNVSGGNLIEWGACTITPNFNLHATQPLLFCAKGDVPPRMLFPNDGTPPGGLVPTALRLNDLSVALVIDRDLNHTVDGQLASLPTCFTSGANTATDCNVFEACLDLNLNFGMQFLNSCPAGKPGFKSTFESVQLLNRQIGVVCGGATSPTSDANVLDAASNPDAITIPIGRNAGQLSPDICGAGLDLGGFVTCDSPEIVSILANPSPNPLKDYLAITCTLK